MPLCKEAARLGNITLYNRRRHRHTPKERERVRVGERERVVKHWGGGGLVRTPSIYYNLDCLSKKLSVRARTYMYIRTRARRALMRCRSLIIPPATRKYAWIIYRAVRTSRGYEDEWLIHACYSLFFSTPLGFAYFLERTFAETLRRWQNWKGLG